MSLCRSPRGSSAAAAVCRRVALVIAAALAAVASPTFAASANAQAPAWSIASVANTTAAPNGSLMFLVDMTNVGDGDSVAPSDPTCDPNNPPTDPDCVTLSMSVPAGLTAVDVGALNADSFNDGACTGLGVPGPTTVTCASSTVVTTAAHSFPNSFRTFAVTMSVDGAASGTLTTSFQIFGGGGAAGPASTVDPTRIDATPPAFGLDAFDGQVASDAAGDPFTQAGGHPFAASTSIDFNTISSSDPIPFFAVVSPVEATKDVLVDLPPGFIGNPTGTDQCTVPELAQTSGSPLCPPSSQIGTALVRINGQTTHNELGPIPVFNVVPPADVPARFGFNVAGTVVTLDARVRSGSDYGLSIDSVNVPEGLAIAGTSLTIWGVPADPSHLGDRACPGQLAPWQGGPSCAVGTKLKAFLRNPTSCTAPGTGLPTTVHIDSWANPGRLDTEGQADAGDQSWRSTTFVSHNPPGYPAPPTDWGSQQGPDGCDRVPFDPTLKATPGSPAKAGAPNGFSFDVTLPQTDSPSAIGEGDLKKAVVTLPAGVRVSPAAADGLGACTPTEIALHSSADPTCPSSSNLGSLTIDTPLLAKSLTGSIYLATPNDNPFGTLIAIYLVAKGPGVIVKLPGQVAADPSTGQLTATFDNNPQLPFSNLHLQFKSGPRAALVTPDQCGTYTTHAVLTSWSGKVVSSDSSFSLSADGNGAPCPPEGFAPGFTAGVEDPVAGADSPFLLQLTRGDQDQRLGGLTVDMPTGLLGRIANAVLCPDGAANAGACLDGSRIGSVTVGAGAGSNPFYITAGRAYITGPYKGAPYGLSIVVPAVAGPFDLGNVVVRAAVFVDKATAQLKVVSDPLPTILQGIPLDVRDVRVVIDRPHFIVNPTSCAQKHVLGTVSSPQGAVAHVSSRFEVGDCASLPLAPKMTLTVGASGHTAAGVSTPLTATLTQTPGQSNLRSVSVTLPGTLNALLPVVNRACKLSEFEAGHCSASARVGSAVAVTPLLRDPLRGSAYFVKNPARAIPDLMVALRGQVSLDLTGKVSIPGGKRLATRFDTIPDAPITKFTLRLVSGGNGPVGIVSNLCTAKSRATTAGLGFRGQNGKLVQVNQRLRINGCPKASRARKARH
jgi:hypothetical protein